jgi:hypothetical protein
LAPRGCPLAREVNAAEPRVVLDVVTTAVWGRGEPRVNLLKRYRRGAGVREMAWELERMVDGNP